MQHISYTHAVPGQCDERVYSGSQYERIVGRPCRNVAKHTLVSRHGGQDRHVCTTHAKQLVARNDYTVKV